MTILDAELFDSYSTIFTKILEEENDFAGSRVEKVIALKSAYDGLIVHGVRGEETKYLF